MAWQKKPNGFSQGLISSQMEAELESSQCRGRLRLNRACEEYEARKAIPPTRFLPIIKFLERGILMLISSVGNGFLTFLSSNLTFFLVKGYEYFGMIWRGTKWPRNPSGEQTSRRIHPIPRSVRSWIREEFALVSPLPRMESALSSRAVYAGKTQSDYDRRKLLFLREANDFL